MNAKELKEKLSCGALTRYAHLYSDPAAQSKRYADAIDAFTALYEMTVRSIFSPFPAEVRSRATIPTTTAAACLRRPSTATSLP